MPIRNLTDSVRPGFPELGRLRKGAKKTSNKPGEDLNYFRFTSDRPEIVAAFSAAYKEQPRMINVFLPYVKAEASFDGEEANFSAWQEQWDGASTLLHRCDGKTVTRWYNTAKSKYVPGAGKLCPYASGEKSRTAKKPGCTQVGRLSVVIPELLEAGFVGYVLVETHSKNDIVSILASLLQIEAECKRYGGEMVGVLCRLQRVEEEITTPEWPDDEPGGKRHKVTKSLLKLSPAPEWVRAIRLEARHRALPARLQEPDTTLDEHHPLLGTEVVVDGATGEILEEAPAEGMPDPEPSPLELALAFETKSKGPLGRVDCELLWQTLDALANKTSLTDYETELKGHIETIKADMDRAQAEGEERLAEINAATQLQDTLL